MLHFCFRSPVTLLRFVIILLGSAEQSFASQKFGSSSSRARAASAFPTDKPNSHNSSDNHLWLGPRGSGGKLYGNVLFQLVHFL
jgi:hypothetical protein